MDIPEPGDYALTVKQPWADLIMAGVKDVENRGWPPPSTLPQWHRCGPAVRRSPDLVASHGTSDCCLSDGPFPFRVWVHAGKQVDVQAVRSLSAVYPLDAPWWPTVSPWFDYLGTRRAVRDEFHNEGERLGVLLGSVEVTGCHHADEDDGNHTTPQKFFHGPQALGFCSEWAEPDAYHWQVSDPQPLDTPIPMRGRQKLWRITADDLELASIPTSR